MGTRRALKSDEGKSARCSKRIKKTDIKRSKTSKPKRPIARASAPVLEKPEVPLPVAPNEKVFRDDPILDRRIIEGMLKDRSALMAEMAKLGYGTNAVLRRAAELGLSEALIRQVKGVAADLAGERPGRRDTPASLGARTCLCCDRVFLSSGPGNRLCMRCRGGDAGLAQL